MTICGKRQNFSARAVIIPMAHIDVDQVGIPKWICQKLSIEEEVTPFNFHKLALAVNNGPDRHPGANYIRDLSGNTISVKYLPSDFRLEHGMKVRRHIVDGDLALMNRQPSLHKMSIMAHRIKVVTGNAFGIHLAATHGYNADFDGDEMSFYVFLGPEGRAEAELMSVQSNIIKDGIPIVKFKQNAVTAVFLMTAPGYTLPRNTAIQIAMQNPTARLDLVTAATTTCSGLDLFSTSLPPLLNIFTSTLSIVNGTMKAGRLKASTLNNIVLFMIWKDLGPKEAVAFLNAFYKLADAFMAYEGLSVGINDCVADIDPKIQEKIQRGISYVREQHLAEPSPFNIFSFSGTKEDNICNVLDKVRDTVGDHVMAKMRAQKHNGLVQLVDSGAKGNETNLVQIQGMLGQQRNERSLRMTDGHHHICDPEKRHGMVSQSFIHGLDPLQYFSHLVGARVGIVDGAVKTADTGYGQRRLAKAMEDISTDQRHGVRNENDMIVQFRYADDGFDPSYTEICTCTLLTMSEIEIFRRFRCFPSGHLTMDAPAVERWLSYLLLRYDWKEEVHRILVLRRKLITQMIQTNENFTTFPTAVNFKRLLDGIPQRSCLVSDLNPAEIRFQVLGLWNELARKSLVATGNIIELFFLESCSTRFLFDRLDSKGLATFLSAIRETFERTAVCAHEPVGLLSAQNCSEPIVQMTLSRFHKSGLSSQLTSGVARTHEIMSAVGVQSTPSMTIALTAAYAAPVDDSRDDLHSDLPYLEFGNKIVEVTASQIIVGWDTNVDSARNQIFLDAWTRWENIQPDVTLVFRMDRSKAATANIHPRKLAERFVAINAKRRVAIETAVSFASFAEKEWWVAVNLQKTDPIWNAAAASLSGSSRQRSSRCTSQQIASSKATTAPMDELYDDDNESDNEEEPVHQTALTSSSSTSDMIVLVTVYDKFVREAAVLSGIRGITDFAIINRNFVSVENGVPKTTQRRVIITQGSNLVEILALPEVDGRHTTTNSIKEIEKVFGIDAACASIKDEWKSVMNSNNAHVGAPHIPLIADVMCCSGKVKPMTFAGICGESTSIAKKVSFEKAMSSFVQGATQGQLDIGRSCADAMVWNSRFKLGVQGVDLVNCKPKAPPASVAAANDREFRSRFVPFVGMSDAELDAFCHVVPKPPLNLPSLPPPPPLPLAATVMPPRIAAKFVPSSPV